MDIQKWKQNNDYKKKYAHFDSRVSLSDVWKYITDPRKITTHAFYPFIHYQKHFDKYNKVKGKSPKARELCYSAHIDRCIFQYYGYMINQVYNDRTRNDGTDSCSIAYRDNMIGKSNIHFAKRAIDFIRQKQNCYIIVGDFTKFFDELDHKYLKERLGDLLGGRLSDDFYAVYKNITKYSIWELSDLLALNNLEDKPSHISELNCKDRILSTEDFRKNKSQIKRHPSNFGIPQGSAISAVLSNVYMTAFDKIVNEYVKSQTGLYMRYSDDFIIILPGDGEVVFSEQLRIVLTEIEKIPRLVLQPDKTQIFLYNNNNITSCTNTFIPEVANGKNCLDYLGFSFDGNVVSIRDKTISKYYYRMYRKLNTIVKSKGYTPKGNKISNRNLYMKYSQKGANVDKGNFITYVQRCESVFGKNEAVARSTKQHMQKIRKKLKQIER